MNKYLPIILVYFFINNLGLPFGLQYTVILAPVLYIWLLFEKERFIITKFVILFFPFTLMHIYNGFESFFYIRSYLLLLLVYIVVYAFFKMITKVYFPSRLMDRVIVINFFIACAALLLLGTSYASPIWVNDAITEGSGPVWRLRLFTYEPSYYATLMVPFFLYSLSSFFSNRSVRGAIYLLLVVVPMILTFSLGVIASLFIASLVMLIWNFRKTLRRKPLVILTLMLMLPIAGVGIMKTDNLLSLRINNVLKGDDSSGNVRTSGANLLAYKVADSTSLWWGAGFGQSKLIIPKVHPIKRFEDGGYRLTNVVASTFATLGIVGLILRFGIELFLFFRTRVYSSNFRLMLFTFMFVYQFTGSYMSNLAEYIIWLFAFVPVFRAFETRHDLLQKINLNIARRIGFR